MNSYHPFKNAQEMQQALLDAGQSLPRYGADGKVGAETRTALRNFEQQAGPLPQGKNLMQVLHDRAEDMRRQQQQQQTPAARAADKPLTAHDVAPFKNVRDMQSALNEFGHKLKVDGDLGAKTRAAFADYAGDRPRDEAMKSLHAAAAGRAAMRQHSAAQRNAAAAQPATTEPAGQTTAQQQSMFVDMLYLQQNNVTSMFMPQKNNTTPAGSAFVGADGVYAYKAPAPQHSYMDVMREMTGLHERTHNGVLKDYLRSGGYGSHWKPESNDYPWCAAYMNTVLQSCGLPRLTTTYKIDGKDIVVPVEAAADFKNKADQYGGKVVREPQKGDLVVYDTGGGKGHVGFVDDVKRDNKGNVVDVKILGGNQTDGVNSQWASRLRLGNATPSFIRLPPPNDAAIDKALSAAHTVAGKAGLSDKDRKSETQLAQINNKRSAHAPPTL